MIGGNIVGIIQMKTTEKNGIGEKVPVWHDVVALAGFLDLQAGDSKRTTFNAKIQESTHIFIGDYKPIPATIEVDGIPVRVTTENVRFVAQGESYDVLLIDDPMHLHAQWEIYLKFTGGQGNGEGTVYR